MAMPEMQKTEKLLICFYKMKASRRPKQIKGFMSGSTYISAFAGIHLLPKIFLFITVTARNGLICLQQMKK